MKNLKTKDLVSFGNYLLSKKRKEFVKGKKRDTAIVWHSDIVEWKESKKSDKIELTQQLRDLVNAVELAKATDFINANEVEFYYEETGLDIETIKSLSIRYDGCAEYMITNKIINILRENL